MAGERGGFWEIKKRVERGTVEGGRERKTNYERIWLNIQKRLEVERTNSPMRIRETERKREGEGR